MKEPGLGKIFGTAIGLFAIGIVANVVIWGGIVWGVLWSLQYFGILESFGIGK